MKSLLLALSFLLLSFVVYAQLNTFKEGDVISAEKMNENFQALEQQFRGARSIKVDCAAGEKINDAIENGFTDITVSGTCNENLLYTVWRDNAGENRQPSNKLAPRYLRISGATADAKITDTTSNSENTISINSGATLFLENIIISGGQYGLSATRNSNLLLSGVSVEGFSEYGIRIADSAWLGIDEDGTTITGSGSGTGINFETGSSGWFETLNISGVATGIYALRGSALATGGYTISASEYGIQLSNSSFQQYWGEGMISETSKAAISVDKGVFSHWSGSISISGLTGGRGINLWQSKAEINNLKLLEFDNTGTGWNPAIRVGNASALNLNNSEISGETDDSLINIDRSSMLEVNNSTILGTGGHALIYAGRASLLEIQNSTVSGTADTLIAIDRASILNIQTGTLSGTVNDALVGINEGSSAEISDSSISGQQSRGINLHLNSDLTLFNSLIDVKNDGIYATNGSQADLYYTSVTTSNGVGIEVQFGSGIQVKENSKVISNSNFAISLIWNSIGNINSSESIIGANGPDVKVSGRSTIYVGEDNQIGHVVCLGKSLVASTEGVITALDDCAE